MKTERNKASWNRPITRCFLKTDKCRLDYRLLTKLAYLPVNLYLNIAKLRTGNHKFPCECGRWLGIDLSQRICTLCNLHEIGDEFHYVLKCPFFFQKKEKDLLIDSIFSNPEYIKV